MTIHIVLVHPKMPSNTGNIIRLCANTGAKLHLIKPLGFELEDKKLRRAGLDYHEYANLAVHNTWLAAKNELLAQNCQTIVALTTKLSHSFYEYDFSSQTPCPLTQNENDISIKVNTPSNAARTPNVALVFGSETAGLPEDIREDITKKNWLRLPMLADSRSLNLANSVAICLYEVWRQQGFKGDKGQSIGYDTLTPFNPK